MSEFEKWLDRTHPEWRRWSFENWVTRERCAFNAGMTRAAELCRADTERLDYLERNVSAIRDIGWLHGPLRAAIDSARSEGGGA